MTHPKPYLIGLTGSIGMGKSTTAQMFADAGVPVWNADAAVARLYAKGGAGVAVVQRTHPKAVVDGSVDRDYLRERIAENPEILLQLEKVVHPLVAVDRKQFITNTDAPIVLLDVPLLFEAGANSEMDLVVVVSTYPDKTTQQKRVLSRPGMTHDLYNTILEKQLPDAVKRVRADVVIQTLTLESAKITVDDIVRKIKEKLANA